jgi:hypothetical protein
MDNNKTLPPASEQETQPDISEQAMPDDAITYNVDKMTFIVTPVYRDGSGKTVHDILLNLMERDCENP